MQYQRAKICSCLTSAAVGRYSELVESTAIAPSGAAVSQSETGSSEAPAGYLSDS